MSSGRTPASELLPGLQAETIEGLMRKVLETGVPVTDYEYVGWSWADPHRQHAYSTSFFPLVAADDSITGVCYMVLDVTERWTARPLCPWSTKRERASAGPWT
ncbi:hypothetical protein SGLAM104S_05908 [Streptomyces glaucescens]